MAIVQIVWSGRTSGTRWPSTVGDDEGRHRGPKRRFLTDPSYRYIFERAERLGMTVGRMMDEMTSAELTEWMALDTLRAKEREKAERMAKKGMNQRRPRQR